MTMEIKRILFIITQSEMGGAQRFILEILRSLARGNYELMLAVGKDGDGSLNRLVAELGISTITLTSLRRNTNPFHDVAAVKEITKLVRNFKPDTLFLNSSKAGFIGSLTARLSGLKIRVIYRIGGWTFNDPWPAPIRLLWVILERFSACWKDVIIVNSRSDYEQAKRLNIRPRGGLMLVHNGIDPYKIHFLDRQEARMKLLGEGHKNKKIIGTLANLYPAKGVETFIQAAALDSNPDAHYLVIGDGPERKKLEEMIIDRDLSGKVVITGRVDNASQYLPAFDIFVLSSYKEGFPWAVLEAMSAKLPVIATEVGAISEIFEEKRPAGISDARTGRHAGR